MTTTFVPPAARGRMRARTPSEDEETLVYRKGAPAALAPPSGALFEQMVRQLSAPLVRSGRTSASRPIIVHTMRPAPNVFEMPRVAGDPPLPWAAEEPPVTDETRKTPKAARAQAPKRRRLRLPSLVIVMSLGIGFGLGHDAAARASSAAHLRGAAHAAWTFIHR